ncbi:MAG: VWA domain-containing protein [Phycisphaerae bacterium]
MSVDFRCENCGKLLSVEAQPGAAVACPHCQNTVTVPEGLANLPKPNVPGAKKAGPPQPPQNPQQPPAQEDQEQVEYVEEDSAIMTVLAAIMPWVISLFLHIGLVVVLAFFVMLVKVNYIPENVVVPDAYMTDDPGGVVNPGQDDPNVKAKSQQKTQQQFSDRESAIPADSGETSEQLLIGAASSGASGGGASISGMTTGGSGQGPQNNFFGSGGGNAHHVVYVIDRSGSMVDTFEDVRVEMIRSIGKLRKVQDFHIILFQKGKPIENTPQELVLATDPNKNAALDFLEDKIATGQTDPVPALERAFEVLEDADPQRPGKLIYLLTDAAFPDNKAVINMVRKHNKSQDVLINTFLYGNRPREAEETMRTIAKENGGRYKYVSRDE